MTTSAEPPPSVSLVVYVSSRSAASTRATANLEDVIGTLPEISVEVEIIDVARDPQRARTDGVYVTPALRLRDHLDNLLLGALEEKTLLRSILRRAAAA